MAKTPTSKAPGSKKPVRKIKPEQLRSKAWFDNPANADMTALYIERTMNFGLSRDELQSGRPIIGIAQTGSDIAPCNRHHIELAPARPRRHPRARRRALRVPDPSDPGNLQAADREPRPQPAISLPGRDPLRLSDRRRRADDRLRQDHAGAADGGGDGRHPGDRAAGRADAQRLFPRRAHRLGHDRLEGARDDGGRRDRLSRLRRPRRLVGAVGRPLQHDGHGLDDELAGRSAAA